MRITFTLFFVLALGACSTPLQNKTGAAVVTPLNDLNLVNAPVPEVLAAAQRGPYALAPEQNCQVLDQDIKALDEALGPDIDAPLNDANHGLLERGTEAGSGAAVGALQRTAEGAIPFRGWIRQLSGAEQHSRQVAAAITAGGVRRAFLKGVRAAKYCATSVEAK